MNLIHSCRIERGHFRKDEEGGARPAQWATVYNNVPCMVQADNSDEAIQFHRLEETMPFRVYTNDQLSLKPQDRLIPLNGFYANKTLNVLGPARDMGGQQRWFRIECELTPSGQHVQSSG